MVEIFAFGLVVVLVPFIGVALLLVWYDLDSDTSHSTTQLSAVLDKELVVVSPSSRARVDELKAVQIQLPFEGRQSTLAEIQRDNFLEELIGLVNRKGATRRHERNDIGAARSFNFSEKTMQFFLKVATAEEKR